MITFVKVWHTQGPQGEPHPWVGGADFWFVGGTLLVLKLKILQELRVK